jgi:hypothetical protein
VHSDRVQQALLAFSEGALLYSMTLKAGYSL